MDELLAALEAADPLTAGSRSRSGDGVSAPRASGDVDIASATAPTMAALAAENTPAHGPTGPASAAITAAQPDREATRARPRGPWFLALGVSLLGASAAIAWTWARPTKEAKTDASSAEAPLAASRLLQAVAAPEENLFPCRNTQRHLLPTGDACHGDTVAWCAMDGARVACCPEGRVARSRDGTCQCPPGGLSADSLDTRCPRSTIVVPPKSMGHLDRDLIQGVVHGGFPQVRQCYEAALKRNPDENGRFEVYFEIGPDGRVFFARIQDSALTDPDAQACMLEYFRALRFPAPVGGVVTVTYPIIFHEESD
jgi:hypothetical protein